MKKTEAEESMEEAEELAMDLPQTGSLSVVIYPGTRTQEGRIIYTIFGW